MYSLGFFNKRNFRYQRVITITERSGSNWTDYQVPIELDSTNFNFSHTRFDGGDIRFTDTAGNLLPYWIESYDASAQTAKIFVKVPSLPANATIVIYMYYGNSSVLSESNGYATFLFFDDAEVIYSDPSTSPPWDVSSLKDSDNPIFSGNNSGVCDVDIGKYNGYYYMVYSEWEGDTDYYRNIYLARSTDLKNWTILNNGNPIIPHGDSEDWDGRRATYMSILKDVDGNIITHDSKFWIFYSGMNTSVYRYKIGRAYRDASGGLEGPFTKDTTNNPLSPFNGENQYHNPVLFKEGSTFYMYYGYADGTNRDWKNHLATSSDLLNWSNSANNPLLSPTGSGWESERVLPEDILKYGSYYYLLYTGFDGTHYRAGLARATSIDTTSWEKEENNPVIDVGTSGDFDDRLIDHGSLEIFDNKYYIFYTGEHASETQQIGLAYLTNSFKWTRIEGSDGELKRSTNAKFTGNYGLEWLQSGNGTTQFIRTSVFPSSGKFIIEMRWKPLTNSSDVYMYCLDGYNGYEHSDDFKTFTLYNRYGKLDIFNGDHHYLLDSLNEQWYHLRLDIDQDSHKILAAYINGEEKLGAPIDFMNTTADLEDWCVGAGKKSFANHYLDNLLVRKYASPEPLVSIGSENVRITFSSYPEGASIEVIK